MIAHHALKHEISRRLAVFFKRLTFVCRLWTLSRLSPMHTQACLIAVGYYSSVYVVRDSPPAEQWSSKEWYGELLKEGTDEEVAAARNHNDDGETADGEFGGIESRVEPPGFWGAADVRDAKSLSSEEFKRDYMLAGKPVIIRGDPGALALAAKLNVDVLLSMCGDQSPDLGNRIVEVVKDGIPEELQQAIDARLRETDGIGLKEVIQELEGNGRTKTLRDFFEGDHFGVRGGGDGSWMFGGT